MMLFTGNLRPGSRVLIHSAAGGVGLAAIQLARSRQCEIYGIASSAKHDFLREQGVAHPIDVAGDWPAEVRRIAGEHGVDLVLDPVGGRSFKEGYRLLGPAGRLVMFGASSMLTDKKRNILSVLKMVLGMPRFGPVALMNDNRTVSGCNMGHLFERLDLLRPQFDDLLALYRAGTIKPHVDRTFRFDEAPAAHDYLHSRKARGKVLLIP
jgi:NADPH:quinone reductase-like Zn-dependent oxidoreductase